MRSSDVRSIGLMLGFAMLAACGGNTPQPRAVPTDVVVAPRAAADVSVAPAMVIERFLRATNQNDLDTMAALFGTRDGSITRVWSQKEVDDRMYILAQLLAHTDYNIIGEQLVPGRRNEATKMNVSMVIGRDTIVVPFTLVRTADQTWLIEEIDIRPVTRGFSNGR